jgi:DNA-binding CsgD family transcriptional regulator
MNLSTVPHTYVRGRLTSEEREQINTLVDEGLKSRRIASRLNRHPSTVNFYLATNGLRKLAFQRRPVFYIRAGRKVYPFTTDEDAYIQALRVQDYTWQQIAIFSAKRFGHRRSAATIGTRLRMLGGQDNADPD